MLVLAGVGLVVLVALLVIGFNQVVKTNTKNQIEKEKQK